MNIFNLTNGFLKYLLNKYFVLTIFLAYAVPSLSAIIPIAYYHLGEDDPGAVIGNVVSSTIDSLGSQNLSGSGTVLYEAGIAPGSSISIRSEGIGSQVIDSGFSFPFTDNFGVEGFFKIGRTNQELDLLLNGTSSFNGWGFTIQGDGNPAGVFTYQGFYGGRTFLNTGIASQLNDVIYMALVRDAGQTSVYFQDIGSGGSLQSFNFGGIIGPSTPSGIFSIRGFDGIADEVRVFSTQSGTFDPEQDLLISQPFQPVPAPSILSMMLLGLAGLGLTKRKF